MQTVYIVVTEDWYGDQNIRAFSKLENAKTYAEMIGKYKNLDTSIITDSSNDTVQSGY